MAFVGSNIAGEAGLRLLLDTLGSSNVVVRTACCSVGIVIPVYSTFKAVERKDEVQQQKWLMYWAAYGSFSLVEVFADKLISWVTMYYHMKFAFLVWLQLPSTEGAKQLYRNHLQPFFVKHQAKVDMLIGFVYHQTTRFISAHQAEIEYTRTIFTKMTSGSANNERSLGPSNQTEEQTMNERESSENSDTESHKDD